MSAIIDASHLRKTFVSSTGSHEQIKALDDLSIKVDRGETLGILGPNGAGKTTFLNVLSTLLVPDSGHVVMDGIAVTPSNFTALRKRFNMSSGYPNFPFSLTVRENLHFYGRLYGLSHQALDRKVDELISLFELTTFADRRFDELSSGNKQRLALAKSLLNDPRIIFLDEPTVGLDPDVAIKLRVVITEVLKSKGVTVLLTTHNMAEAEEMCDRVAFIKSGRIIQLSTPAELKATYQSDDLEEVFVHLAKHPAGGQVIRPEAGISNMVQGRDVSESADVSLWLNRCGAFCLRNYIFAVRNFFSFVELLFWPMVSVISIGLMGNYLELGRSTLNFIMTGAIAAGVLQVAQLDVAYSLLYEVWSKSLKQTLLAPVGVTETLFGSWIIGIVRGLFIFAVLSLFAVMMFGFTFPSWTVTTLFLGGLLMCAFLLGLLVNIVILSFGQKAEITTWMFAYLFMLLCGIYYPVETLPAFFKALAQAIPITYFLAFFRGGNFTDAAVGFLLVAFYFASGLYFLKIAYHRARCRGTIIRLSE